MNQLPRYYRKRLLEEKLGGVLTSPLSNQSDVRAARKAVEEELDHQDLIYKQAERNTINFYLTKLRNKYE